MSCPDCFRGQDHIGPTNGFETIVNGVNTYVTIPPQTSENQSQSVIVIFSDAFGWGTVNLRRLADSYARRTGCRVFLPDFMYGEYSNQQRTIEVSLMDILGNMGSIGTALPAWVKGNMDRILSQSTTFWDYVMKPILIIQTAYYILPFRFRNHPAKRYHVMVDFVSSLRTQLPRERKIGVAGFCWGAYAATHMAKDITPSDNNGLPLIDAAFSAHPSEVTADDFSGIKRPYSMIIGDVDFAMKIEEVKKAADILVANKGVASEVVVIPGARHGFAVRGNPNDPVEKEMADQAEDQLVKWFNAHLS